MEFIGQSKAIGAVLAKAPRLAAGNGCYTVIGETGVGKTHLARILHYNSARKPSPFVMIDMRGETDGRKKLFGCTRTSILGIQNVEDGAIASAKNGTLVIKNPQCLPLDMQPQLLATVELGGYRPVKSEDTLKSSCRFVFTLPSRPEKYLGEKRLTPEFTQLLSINVLELSALKERQEDIEPLANYFVKKWCEGLGLPVKTLTKSALKLLKKSAWHGNVAELQMLILNAVIGFNSSIIDSSHLQTRISGNWKTHTEKQLNELALEKLVEDKLNQFMQRLGKYNVENLYDAIMGRIEGRLIKIAMEKTQNNQLRAARMLGINRNTLRSKLAKLQD